MPAKTSSDAGRGRSLPVLARQRPLAPHPPELLRDTVTADGRRRYCSYPFRLLALASDVVQPCTWLRKLPGENVLPAAEAARDLPAAWRSEAFENVRRSIAAGDYLHCDLEFCPEFRGAQRYLLTLEELRERFPAIHAFVAGRDARFSGGPQMVNLSHDTDCNLSCPACNRHELPKLGDAGLRGVLDTLPALAAGVEYLFVAGMGDPFASQHYLQWLRTLDLGRFPALREIILNTNGLLWNQATWSSIPEATRRRIGTAIVSIDGAGRETFEQNRYPARWDALLASLRFITSLRRRGELRRLRCYFVYQWNNFHELPAMVAFCRAHGFDEVFFARLSRWTSISQWMHDSLDVGNPAHPDHAEFLELAAATAKLGSDDLEVVVMR